MLEIMPSYNNDKSYVSTRMMYENHLSTNKDCIYFCNVTNMIIIINRAGKYSRDYSLRIFSMHNNQEPSCIHDTIEWLMNNLDKEVDVQFAKEVKTFCETWLERYNVDTFEIR